MQQILQRGVHLLFNSLVRINSYCSPKTEFCHIFLVKRWSAMSYLKIAKKVSSRRGFGDQYELIRTNELNSECTHDADSLVADSLERINASVAAEVTISDWDAIDRFTALADDARDRGDIPALRQALSDMERVVKQQVADFQPLVVYDWDDGRVGPLFQPVPQASLTPWCPRYRHPGPWRPVVICVSPADDDVAFVSRPLFEDNWICVVCHPPRFGSGEI